MSRTAILDEIYALHAQWTHSGQTACKPCCATCCTRNVTATDLEVSWFLEGLEPEETEGLKDLLTPLPAPRLQPLVTLNGFAEACMKGEDTPEEEADPSWSPCPLLSANGLCTVYDRRPLGCRAMMSESACSLEQPAEMPERTLVIHSLFQQLVEHLDCGNRTGNFLDLLKAHIEAPLAESSFPENRKVPVWMVPPELKTDLAPLLVRLSGMLTEH